VISESRDREATSAVFENRRKDWRHPARAGWWWRVLRGVRQDQPDRCRPSHPAKESRNPSPLRLPPNRSPSHPAGPPRAPLTAST